MRRADYEIYTFNHGGVKYWAFDVEYFGHYVAKSEQEILEKVDKIKVKVADRLREIDRLNAEYYERLNRETEELAKALKEYRESRNSNRLQTRSPLDKREMLQEVRDMLLMGATLDEVLDAVPDANARIVSHVRSHLHAKKLL